MPENNPPREQSEFNMALSYLNRLNALFYQCDEAAMEMDINSWFQSLMTLFRELSTELKPEEIKSKNSEIKILFESVNQATIQNNRRGKRECPTDIYWKIHDLELYLRKLLKASGLQQKMKESGADALR